MGAVRRALMAGVATLVVAAACTSVSTPTTPPINLPSIPPINLPGTSGGGITLPGFSIPPINLPGFSIPPGAAQCALISGAEVGQVMGGSVTDTSDTTTDCTFVTSLTSAISVNTSTDSDFTGAAFLMGSTAQQSTLGGFPALVGVVLGQPAVYVQKPSGQLQVLGILTGSDSGTITKLEQIATIAVGRMP